MCLRSCSQKKEENRRQTQRTKSLFPPSAFQSSFSKPLAKPNRELAGTGQMCFAESQPKHHKAECGEVRGGVLYNKEYDWPLSLASGRKILNPWKFPSNRSVFVIQEPLGSHLNLCYQDDSEGDWSPEWPTMGWEGWDFKWTWPPEKGEGLKIEFSRVANDLIHQVHIMKPQ